MTMGEWLLGALGLMLGIAGTATIRLGPLPLGRF